jgi:hypothetical protein
MNEVQAWSISTYIDSDSEKRNYSEKTQYGIITSNTSSTWAVSGSNPEIRSYRSATKARNHGMAPRHISRSKQKHV